MDLRFNSCTYCKGGESSLWKNNWEATGRDEKSCWFRIYEATSCSVIVLHHEPSWDLWMDEWPVEELPCRYFGRLTLWFHYCKCNGSTPAGQKAAPTINWKRAPRRLACQHIPPSCAPGGGLKNSRRGVKKKRLHCPTSPYCLLTSLTFWHSS